jgi:REP element-mobilizing transposase RayT
LKAQVLNRAQLPNRRTLRLPEYDYRDRGAYFVTICTAERRFLFEIELYRQIADACWRAIPEHLALVTLDEYMVMPNHVHGIVAIDIDGVAVGAQHAAPAAGAASKRRTEPGSLGAIVRSYKSAVTKAINERRRGRNPIWQQNYYEHVIRNEASLNRIRQYIIGNSMRWAFDRDNPQGSPDDGETSFWSEYS